MKIPPRRIDAFVAAPDPACRAILIYGPDRGLARERLAALTVAVAVRPDDPFLVADLSADTLLSDPARLADEAAAQALTGGRRVVILREAGDRMADIFASFLDDPPGDGLILVTADDLAARSRLRKVFEDSPNAAALPCYADDARGVGRLLDEVMRAENVRISPDARDFLIDNLGADRGISRMELEKLALYAGPGGRLESEDVTLLTASSGAVGAEDVFYAAGDGDAGRLDRALDLAFEMGNAPGALLRGAGGHMLRLLRVRSAHEQDGNMSGAMQKLRPRVFWKHQDRFQDQVRRWRTADLSRALGLLLAAEAQCKQTGMPDRLICARTLQQTAAMARRHRR